MTARPSGDPGPDLVRRLFAEHADGHFDAVLACVHPEILWEVEGVPAREFYAGRAGTLALLADMRDVFGDHWTRVDDATTLPDGRVLMTATLLARSPEGDVPVRDYRALFTLRDGLVSRFEDATEMPHDTARSPETGSGSDCPSRGS